MTGVLASGEGVAIASLLTYIIILLIPVLMLIFGILERRRNTEESRKASRALFVIAGLTLLVIIGFFIITAI